MIKFKDTNLYYTHLFSVIKGYHTHFKYNIKAFLICIILQTTTGCSLDEPLHTLLCPEKSSVSDQFLGVIDQSIYAPNFHIPDGYIADYHNLSQEISEKTLCPTTEDPQARYYDYCVLVEDPSTHERRGVACSFCPQDQILCNDQCTTINTNPDHCGKCDRKCERINGNPAECRQGHCFDQTCPEHAIQCEENISTGIYVYCVDPSSHKTCGATCDNRNGTACTGDEVCIEHCEAHETAYACECKPDFRRCGNRDCIPNSEACVLQGET